MTPPDIQIADQHYETVPVDTLTPHPQNPRRGDKDSIRESMSANGFYGAVVVQQSTNIILAGRHRWETAKEAGATEVPAIIVDVDDATARRIVAADNRTHDKGGYDDTALLALLQDVATDDSGLFGTAFSDDDLSDMIAEVELSDDTFDRTVTAGGVGDVGGFSGAVGTVSGDTAPSESNGSTGTAPGDFRDGNPDYKEKFQKDAQRLDASRRMIVLDLPVNRFVWMIDALQQVCSREDGIDTNAEALLWLAGEYIGEPVPAADE